MKTTMAACSRPTTTMMGAASRVAAAGLAVIVLGITAVPTRAGCYPADRINAQCYADLQTATAAALAANQPLWLPAGTYTLQQELVIDYSPLAATGFQIISDGAVIDATAIGQRAMSIECSGGSPNNPKGCFYFHIQGTLFVNANTSGAAVRFGLNDFSDAHNSAKIDHLIVNNAGSGWAVRLNYVLNADIFAVAVSAGSVGLVMDRCSFRGSRAPLRQPPGPHCWSKAATASPTRSRQSTSRLHRSAWRSPRLTRTATPLCRPTSTARCR